MAQNLADLLVSYNQVQGPEIEVPDLSRYDRMIQFADQKKATQKTDTPETVPPIQWAWTLPEGYENSTSQKGTPSTEKPKETYYRPRTAARLSDWRTMMTRAYKAEGMSDNAIRNLLAKNALESNYGKSTVGNFNYGNLTAGRYWKGSTKSAEDNGKQNIFRSYSSMQDYVKDEIQFLTKLYDFNQNDDIDTFLNKLQGNNHGNRRYAEDSKYIQKVKDVYGKLYG